MKTKSEDKNSRSVVAQTPNFGVRGSSHAHAEPADPNCGGMRYEIGKTIQECI